MGVGNGMIESPSSVRRGGTSKVKGEVMEKDGRKTIALWVIICFVVFSFGYAMVPLSRALHNYAANPVPAKPATSSPARTNAAK
jgi:hypothetical protein